MNQSRTLIVVLLLGVGSASVAQDNKAGNEPPLKKEVPAKDDAAHDELREVKKAMTDAFNKKDLDALLKYVHPDAVVTWQNGEVSRGPAGVRKYYERMLVGDQSVLKSVTADPEVTDLALLIGTPPTTAVAYGKLKDHYKLRDGTEIAMDSLFSATLVKQEGRWLIVSFHGSTNVFDNSVLKVAITKTMWWTGGIAAAVALLIGLIAGRLLFGRKGST
jgi:ketosteroid isomerase-like protein